MSSNLFRRFCDIKLAMLLKASRLLSLFFAFTIVPILAVPINRSTPAAFAFAFLFSLFNFYFLQYALKSRKGLFYAGLIGKTKSSFKSLTLQYVNSELFIIYMLFFSFSFLSALWSWNVEETLSSSLKLLIYPVVAMFWAIFISRQNINELSKILYYSLILCFCVFVVAYIVNYFRTFEYLRLYTDYNYIFNRPVIIFVFYCILFFIFTTFMASKSGCDKTMRVRVLLIYLLMIVVVFASSSQSAELGVILFTVVYFMCKLLPQLFFLFSGGVIIFVTITFPFLATQMAHFLFQNEFILRIFPSFVSNSNAVLRLVLWDRYSKLANERFWLGHGYGLSGKTVLKSFPVLDKFSHAHSMPIQLWFELGVVGQIIMILFILVILLKIFMTKGEVRNCLIATMATFFAIWTVSHGTWQSWWMVLGLIIFATVSGLIMRDCDHNCGI